VNTDLLVQSALLVLAGVGSGIVGYGAGLASLVSFPALLACGLPALAANVTNSVALIGNSIGGISSAQPELRGMRSRILKFGAAGLVGGVVGALLLLALPAAAFDHVVPWLVALGAVVLLLRPWLVRLHAGRVDEHHPAVPGLIGLISVYGGYFGAGAGTLLTAAFGAVMHDSLARLSALRSVVLGAANGVAALIFISTGLVDWTMAIPLGIGTVAGSALGPPILRRIPERALRILVAIAGFGLAIDLYLRLG
jgi:uncharacterized membrane protein YfcA